MADLGFNAYRFGVEWARSSPRRAGSRAPSSTTTAACAQRASSTASPRWSPTTTSRSRAGSRGTAVRGSAGGRPVRALLRAGDRAPRRPGAWVCTINEANLIAMLMATRFAPVATATTPTSSCTGRRSTVVAVAAARRMTAAHRKAFDAIKSVRDDIQVGWSLAIVDMQAAPGGDERLAEMRRPHSTGSTSRATTTGWRADLLARLVGPDGMLPPPRAPRPRRPAGRSTPSARAHGAIGGERSGRPVMVTENGLATSDDDARRGTPTLR